MEPLGDAGTRLDDDDDICHNKAMCYFRVRLVNYSHERYGVSGTLVYGVVG